MRDLRKTKLITYTMHWHNIKRAEYTINTRLGLTLLFIGIISHLHEAASPIACGNAVAFPELPSPLRHSVFQLHGSIPSLEMAGAGPPCGPDHPLLIWTIISSKVNRLMRSFTLSSHEREVFRNGNLLLTNWTMLINIKPEMITILLHMLKRHIILQTMNEVS